MVSPYGNRMISEVARGLRGSEYGREHRAQVNRIEAAARPYADRIGATSDWSGGGRGPTQLRQLQARINAGRYDDTQTARLYNSLERNMGGFVSALEGGNLLSYVDRVAGARAPARRAAPRTEQPAPARAQPRERSATPPPGRRQEQRQSAAQTETAPPAEGETPVAPSRPTPPPPDYIASAFRQTQGESADNTLAGRTFAQGFSTALAPVGISGFNSEHNGGIASNLSEILSQNESFAAAIGSEIATQGHERFRGNIDAFLNGRPANGDQPAVTPGDLQFLVQTNPAVADALVPALARADPDFAEAMFIEGGIRPMMEGLTPEQREQYRPLIESMAPQFAEALRDPERAANILDNIGDLMGGENISRLSPEQRMAILDDMMAKPDYYVRMLASSDPKRMINGLSEDAFAAIAPTMQPTGIQGMLASMILGSDFDYGDPNNQEILAYVGAQGDHMKNFFKALSSERELIAANGGGASFSFASFGRTIREYMGVFDSEERDALMASSKDLIEFHSQTRGLTESVSLVTVNAYTGETFVGQPELRAQRPSATQNGAGQGQPSSGRQSDDLASGPIVVA